MKTTILILALICLGGVAARTAGNACPAGQFSIDSKICKSCSPSTFNGCVACGADKCTECGDGWVLNDKGVCEKFNDSCAEKLCDVSGTQACGKCADGFRPAKKDTTDTAYCVACAQGNCATCTVDSCTECNGGFFLENKACTACSAGCVECTSATACTTCGLGYFSNAGACTACGTGCAVCTAADKCTTCSVDNILNSTTGACTSKTGCEEGDGTDKCKTCRDGFRLLADGSCKTCDSSAQTCDGSGTDQTILTCNVNLILATATATAKAACQTRTDGVCLNQDAAGVCSKCEGSNWVVSKGKCVLCSSVLANCKSCQAGDATTAASCSGCVDNSYATGSPITSCTLCAGNCKSCTSSACSECAEGNFKNGATATTCTGCSAGGAASCTQLYDATSCLSGYGEQTHGICFKCDPSYNCVTCSAYQVCSTCAVGSGLSTTAPTANQCVVCDVNCKTDDCVNGPGTCSSATGCDAGWFLDKVLNKCVDKCTVAGCSACDATDYSKCTTCKTGYYLTTGTCTACASGCRTCTGTGATATDCSNCLNGKNYDLTTGAVKICTDNCHSTTNTNIAYCDTTAGGVKTAVCNDGFGLSGTAPNQVCTACTVTGCKTCPTAPATCATCLDGYHGTTTCTLCGTNVATCDATNPLTCKATFCLGGPTAARVCLACPTFCAHTNTAAWSADFTVASQCGGTLACDSGYVKISNVCTKCTTDKCTTCDVSQVCSVCSTGYNLSSTKTCLATVDSATDGCLTHVSNEYDKCSVCISGWWKDATATTCTKCSGGCTCTSATTCDACLDTNHQYISTSDPKVCKTCSVENCLTCTSDAAKCTVCKSKFYKESDTKCTACPEFCIDCTATACNTCDAGYVKFTFATATATSAKYCAKCADNCKTCTVTSKGEQTCTLCNTDYYLNGKSCSKSDCSGTDGKVCNKCLYGKILKDGKCADCTGDNSCPASCNAATSTTTGPTGNATNTTSATDSGSKIAFSLFVLAFFAILGHMII